MTMAELRTATGTWDELIDAEGRPRPAAAALTELLRDLGLAELQERQDLAELDILALGHHVHGVLRRARHRPGVAVRRRSPGSSRRSEWRRIERRPDAAAARRSTCSSTTCTTTSASSPTASCPPSCSTELGELPARVPSARRRRSACGRTSAAATSCATPTARCTSSRTTCGCPPGVSYMLENRRDLQARVRRPVRAPEHPARRRLHRRAAPMLAVARPRRRAGPGDRGAHAGHLQLARTSSTRSSPSGWASSWWRAATSSSATTTACTCARSAGLERVDVIYRRIDDLFLDPEVFRPDSMLGVPGLMRAWRAGKVAIANAPARASPTTRSSTPRCRTSSATTSARSRCCRTCPRTGACTPTSARTCWSNLDELVVKPANESGGYGMLIGNRATPERARRASPR